MFAAIEERREDIIELLSTMVRISTVSGEGDQQSLVEVLESWLNRRGIETELIPRPGSLPHNAIRREEANLLGRLGSDESGPSVWLNAHLDTVPPVLIAGDREKWRLPPFGGDVFDGRMWGRGACDSKGRLAGYIACLLGLLEGNGLRRGEVVLAATRDEETCESETTGLGLIARGGHLNADYAVVEGMIDEINVGNMGELIIDVRVRGSQLHTSQRQSAPEVGGDYLIRKLCEVMRLAEEPAFTGRLTGAERLIVQMERVEVEGKDGVADPEVNARINCAIPPDVDVTEVSRRITEILRTSEASGVSTETWIRAKVPGLSGERLTDFRIADALQGAGRVVLGRELPIKPLSGRTDAWLLAKNGVDVANFGAGRLFESNLHLPNENVRVEDVFDSARVCASAIITLMERDV